jgi:antirestriction protein ArdC
MALTKKSNQNFKDIYQEVTDTVIKALEEGTVIWQCPWNKVGLPKNITTGIDYRGWNIFWLNFHTMTKGYKSPFYITYKQAQDLGGTVKKGEKGIKITYWATIVLKNKNLEETTPTAEDTEQRNPTKLVPKDHTVFNIDQTEGIDFPTVESILRSDVQKIEACDKIIDNMPQRPAIWHYGSQAYYTPTSDTVVVPELANFKTNVGYYSTLFHELAHSTGHKKRLDRKEINEPVNFGNDSYSREELTAELTAAFLCAITGIERETQSNSQAYIKGWLKALNNDKKLIFKAASQAQKAADFILSANQSQEDSIAA